MIEDQKMKIISIYKVVSCTIRYHSLPFLDTILTDPLTFLSAIIAVISTRPYSFHTPSKTPDNPTSLPEHRKRPLHPYKSQFMVNRIRR
jgi:hypothetical protein